MKKLVLSVMILMAVSACKKESTVVENSETDSTAAVSVSESNEPTEAAVPFKKVEFSPEETTQLLANQKNDTLYVTNFFATWCGPCVKEIPHFKAKMAELKDQPVKFRFVSLDDPKDWAVTVPEFAARFGLSQDVILLDGKQLTAEFFPANFKEWDGGAIPFTFMRKGDKTDETLGMMSEDMLSQKINSFK